jgi:hypothetical protein
VPKDCGELPRKAVKEPDEEPDFMCLMEDDAMITEVAVTTDLLLTPFQPHEINHVRLVIQVKIRIP